MKKIGISTVTTGYNYGSVLQAYASQAVIKKLGYNPEILKIQGSILKGRDFRFSKLFNIILRFLTNPFLFWRQIHSYQSSIKKPLSKESRVLFDRFRCENLKVREYSWQSLKRLSRNDEYVKFLCGSDQVWSSDALYVDPLYYLRFAPQNKRVAFAPSFGKDFIPHFNKEKVRKFINEIPRLSVRESSGVEIISQLCGRTAHHLCDPTLLLSSDEWTELLDLPYKDDNYILCYFLDKPRDHAVNIAVQKAKELGCRIFSVPYSFDGCNLGEECHAGPKEFLTLIKNSKFILTDSFHGTVFSILFKKPFSVFERNYANGISQSTRITSLLASLNLGHRFKASDANIDTGDLFEAEKLLEKKKLVTYDYLKEAL
jgi:hypothetical protein